MDDIINFKINLRSSWKAITEGEQWGEVRNTKIWMFREWKELFSEIKLFKGYQLLNKKKDYHCNLKQSLGPLPTFKMDYIK